MRASVWGGVAGVALGTAVVMWVHSNEALPSTTIMALWPSSIFGFGYNGDGGWTGLLVGTIVFGGQALLYGGIGAAIGKLIGTYFKETGE